MCLPVSIALLFVLTLLAPLALASPPDPIWIQGIFDAGDSDDAIVAATSTEGATDGAASQAAAVLLAVGFVPARRVRPAPVSSRSTCRGRAPPAA